MKIFTAIIGTAALLLAFDTNAQSNNRDYGRPIDTPANRSDLVMRIAAYCSVRKVHASARKVLVTEFASKDESKRVGALKAVARECFQSQWPDFQPTAFRNAIAEAFYLESYRVNSPKQAASASLPASFAVVSTGTTGTPEQEGVWQLAALGRCTVYAAPQESRQLILGPRNVDEEVRRFNLLKPALARCAPSSDVLTAYNFRGFVAAALFDSANPTGLK